MPVLDAKLRRDTDYLTHVLRDEQNKAKEIFSQMLYQLESVGLCRAVYHRLGYVWFNDVELLGE